MKCQFTLTAAEGKRLIAKAIASMPEVKEAIKEGLILLKGGTSVSAVAEELCGEKMRISGRITPRGTVAAGNPSPSGFHLLLLRKGVPETAEGRLREIAAEMGPTDIAICGANIVDPQGRAAIMAGRDLCGETGGVYPALEAEGIRCIVAAGLEKLSPYPLPETSREAGRKASVWSMGMAVGLVSIPGQVINEMAALSILGFESCWLIGRGGIDGAEGSSTFIAEAEETSLQNLLSLIKTIKGAAHSGVSDSLNECLKCGPGGIWHMACCYTGKARKFTPTE